MCCVCVLQGKANRVGESEVRSGAGPAASRTRAGACVCAHVRGRYLFAGDLSRESQRCWCSLDR